MRCAARCRRVRGILCNRLRDVGYHAPDLAPESSISTVWGTLLNFRGALGALGRAAGRVGEPDVLPFIANYALANDLSVPNQPYRGPGPRVRRRGSYSRSDRASRSSQPRLSGFHRMLPACFRLVATFYLRMRAQSRCPNFDSH